MKKLALFLSLALAATVSIARAEEKPAPKPAAAHHQAAAKTHEVQAEVVSADAAEHTLTIKGDPANTTVPVSPKAAASLKTLKAGEKVTLTCLDDEKGQHLKVTHIAMATEAHK